MRRAALIYNPTSGRRKHAQVLDTVLATLRDGGFAVEPAPTSYAGEATLLARGQAADGCEVVFSFGGDGTAREVAAGLLGTPAALGFLPGGTANVLSLGFGLPNDPVRAAAALCTAPVRDFDVGLAGGLAGGQSPFLMMVSAGLDAAILAALDLRLKRRLGKGAYAVQGLREWWRYSYSDLDVIADGKPLTATFAAVANIPYYAGSFRLAPDAQPDNRRFELVLFHGRGRLATLGFAIDLFRGVHVRRRDVTVLRAKEIVLAGPAGAAAQLDGDLCSECLPLTVRLAPDRLKVLFPARRR
ncbi:MAG TPA: diacylglycerol kinase family protein [Thermoanaerobaculia bacterium]|nr:diacylglycerol kinase family protein [Thermoanaerobaculia bacterium]